MSKYSQFPFQKTNYADRLSDSHLNRNQQRRHTAPESSCHAASFCHTHPILHWRFSSPTFISIIESSHICPGQENCTNTQPASTCSPFWLHFSSQRGETNQGRNGFPSSRERFVRWQGWVGKMRKGEIWQHRMTREWILQMAVMLFEWTSGSEAVIPAVIS